MTLRTCALLLLCLSACACSRPEPPPTDQPVEPQADTATEQHTELRDAIQRPIDKAKAVEDTVLDAAERQQAEIDAQTGQ